MILPIENQRVKDLINYYHNGNELLFSKSIGISQPRINRLFSIDVRNGKYPIVSFDIIQSIINKFIMVSAEWLITGKGEMLKKNEIDNELGQNFENNVELLLEKISLLEEQNSILKENIELYKEQLKLREKKG
jgi:hypothetical protein